MEDTYWDNSPDEELYDFNGDPIESETPFAFVNGSRTKLEAGNGFSQTIKDVARNAGFGKFRVILNGNELKSPSDAPELIGESDRIEIRKYDVAGTRL